MALGLSIPNPLDVLFRSELGTGLPPPPAFVIRELTGQARTVELHGRALPFRPVSWGARQRTRIAWYQGNKVATQQVLGPETVPTTIEGTWSDRYIADTVYVNASASDIRSAEQCVALFYDLLSSGNTLRVTWGSESRIGVLKEFVPSWDRQEDVRWRCEFEWSAFDDSVQPRALKEQGQNLLDKMNALDDLLASGTLALDMTRAVTASTLAAVDRVREKIGQSFDIIRALGVLVAAPATLLGALRSAVESIRLELTEEIQRMTETPSWGARSGHKDGSPAVSARPASLIRVEDRRREIALAMMALMQASLSMLAVQEDRHKPKPIAVITVSEDTSFYAISSRFYGTPDLAGYLARTNGQQSMVAVAGVVLSIPPRPAPGAEAEAC